MRVLLFFISSFLLHNSLFAQQLPNFKPLRYNEDYSWLKQDSSGKGYARIKFIPLARQSFVSIGGETRLQYFYSKNEEWGDAGSPDQGYLLSRSLLHADLHAGKRFRTFIQLQSSVAINRAGASAVEDNALEIHQAFADLNLLTSPAHRLTLRAGRQELSYGSQRLISVREGPNNRQSFDAANIIFTTKRTKVDLFYGHYVAAKKGLFNDDFNKNTRIWGIYLVQQQVPIVGNADLYYLGLWKKRSVFNNGNGEEKRHSIGTRLWSNDKDWKYDIEALVQFGTLGSSTIRAWTASVNTSYTFSHTSLQPEIGLKAELISGDRAQNDSKIQTFNPLFPRGAYFGLAALIGPSNLIDLHPSISIDLNNKWEAAIDHDLFWRYSTYDGIYAVNGALIYTGTNTREKFIGGQTTFSITGKLNPFMNVRGEMTWFDAGNYLKAVGSGKDILFTGITAQLKF